MKVTDFNKLAEKFLTDLKDPLSSKTPLHKRAVKHLDDWQSFDGSTTKDDKVNSCMKTLIKKGDEYSTDDDKLHNFKKATKISCEDGFCRIKLEPFDVAYFFYLKHLTSIQDLLDGTKEPTKEICSEKFGDAINYMVLMYAIECERTTQDV